MNSKPFLYISPSWVTVDTNQTCISSSVDEIAKQQQDTESEWDGQRGNAGSRLGVMNPDKKGTDSKGGLRCWHAHSKTLSCLEDCKTQVWAWTKSQQWNSIQICNWHCSEAVLLICMLPAAVEGSEQAFPKHLTYRVFQCMKLDKNAMPRKLLVIGVSWFDNE